MSEPYFETSFYDHHLDQHLEDDNSSDTLKLENHHVWCSIPVEISDLILSFLGDIDMCGYLPMIAKESAIIPTETIYEQLCRRVYLRQSSKRLINVSNWGSWRNMLIYRPRLRTNGFYSIRTSYWKAPCNDAFWEEKKHEFIEVNVIIISFLPYVLIIYSYICIFLVEILSSF